MFHNQNGIAIRIVPEGVSALKKKIIIAFLVAYITG